MSTRQYIGARYVPKFFSGAGGSTEWVSGVAYEPLTIVTHLGNSYTSKKPVPVGIDILNSEYWASTGLLNSQVEQYREEVEALQRTVDAIPTKRNIILIGDSYVQGVGGKGNDIRDKIRSLTGWTVESYYQGGCGYLRPINDKTFRTLLQDAIADIYNKDIVTDIVIAGSVYNDTASGATEEQFILEIEAIQTLVKTNFPNARLTIAPLWCGYLDSYNVFDVYNKVIGGAQAAGANFPAKSVLWLALKSDWRDTDNIHPSASGYAVIAEKLVSVLNGTDPGIYVGFARIQADAKAGGANIYVWADGQNIIIRGRLAFGASIETFYYPFSLPWWAQKAGGYIQFHKIEVNDSANDLRAVVNSGIPYIGSQAFSANSSYNVEANIPIVEYNYQT